MQRSICRPAAPPAVALDRWLFVSPPGCRAYANALASSRLSPCIHKKRPLPCYTVKVFLVRRERLCICSFDPGRAYHDAAEHLPSCGSSYSRLGPLATCQPTGLPRIRQRSFEFSSLLCIIKKSPIGFAYWGLFGEARETRTPNRQIRSLRLYPLS